MYDTVLVPTDGGGVTDAAGEYGCALADRVDADPYVTSVTEDGSLLDSSDDQWPTAAGV